MLIVEEDHLDWLYYEPTYYGENIFLEIIRDDEEALRYYLEALDKYEK